MQPDESFTQLNPACQRVFVLGHRGMLGHVVVRLLSELGHTVITSDERYMLSDSKLIQQIKLSDADVIVNCMGRIVQKKASDSEFFITNTLLPLQLLQCLKPTQRLIHISTDCVFSGKLGKPYAITDKPDPTDVYGSSKALAEIIATDPRVNVFRTSIIGPETASASGLMSWFLNSSQQEIFGYTNHIWNGVTTLRLAQHIEALISKKHTYQRLEHIVSSDYVSKFELLLAINDIWQLRKNITPVKHAQNVDRRLLQSMVQKDSHIFDQLIALKDWY